MRGTLGRGETLAVHDLGQVGYAEALALQHRLVRKRQDGTIPDTLLLLEHPPVITMGRSALDTDILATSEQLLGAGATVERIERGGETTYHGPGQLVGYVIIDLRTHLRSLKRFVHLLEEVFISLLGTHYGISADRDPEHRGVWVGDEKITAIGIAVQKRVTFHGFAFNVNTDLSHFQWIVPCGITDRGQTSLKQLTGEAQDMDRLKQETAGAVAEVFGFTPDYRRGYPDVD
ncbi:MAG: lipoyl(octanoyl) transferase LipB [Spirochaetaceae bacterium]|nr:MAG: lipoyl(octanoyl) transferase LipB [Spirochaetaceae bacterium]